MLRWLKRVWASLMARKIVCASGLTSPQLKVLEEQWYPLPDVYTWTPSAAWASDWFMPAEGQSPRRE